jgi:uncharacterized protein (DUF885 family)
LNLPRAVIEAERKAEEALQRLQAARQPQQSQADEAQPPTDPQPPTPDAASETPAPAADPAPAPTATPPGEGDDKWEARYKTLHGKYNAEVPRLHAALKERDSKLNSLTEEVEALKAAVSNPRESLIKPEEVNEFGEPLVDLIRRAARDEMAAKDAEIAALKREVESVKTSTVENKEVSFYDKLNSQVPDWMAINDDPDFHAWLGEVDDLTGALRQEILSAAEGKRDADRVARFFKAFKKVQETKSAAATASLDSQVAPVASRVDEPPKGKKIWTRAEIADFYARDRRGELTEEQSAAIDKEVQLAIRERRVR